MRGLCTLSAEITARIYNEHQWRGGLNVPGPGLPRQPSHRVSAPSNNLIQIIRGPRLGVGLSGNLELAIVVVAGRRKLTLPVTTPLDWLSRAWRWEQLEIVNRGEDNSGSGSNEGRACVCALDAQEDGSMDTWCERRLFSKRLQGVGVQPSLNTMHRIMKHPSCPVV